MEFFEKFVDAVKFVFTFKAYVMLPIIILVFGLIIRIKINMDKK